MCVRAWPVSYPQIRRLFLFKKNIERPILTTKSLLGSLVISRCISRCGLAGSKGTHFYLHCQNTMGLFNVGF